MNAEQSRQMAIDGLRGVYAMMRRLDGRPAGAPHSEECLNAIACIAYSMLDAATGHDAGKLITLIGTMMMLEPETLHLWPDNQIVIRGKLQ